MNNYAAQNVHKQLQQARVTHDERINLMITWYRELSDDEQDQLESIVLEIMTLIKGAGVKEIGPVHALELTYLWIAYKNQWPPFHLCQIARKA